MKEFDSLEPASPSTHEDELPANLDRRFFSHAEHPRHLGALETADGKATGKGVCGDSMDISIAVRNGKIVQVGQVPHGCLYTIASASAISELCIGKSLEEALKILPEDVSNALGGLPEDHLHCARLAVNTLGEAIEDDYRKAWSRKPTP